MGTHNKCGTRDSTQPRAHFCRHKRCVPDMTSTSKQPRCSTHAYVDRLQGADINISALTHICFSAPVPPLALLCLFHMLSHLAPPSLLCWQRRLRTTRAICTKPPPERAISHTLHPPKTADAWWQIYISLASPQLTKHIEQFSYLPSF